MGYTPGPDRTNKLSSSHPHANASVRPAQRRRARPGVVVKVRKGLREDELLSVLTGNP